MQTPTTTQIRTAIIVLRKFGEHINHNAANPVIELPDTRFGDHVAARVEVMNIEQVTRIRTIAAQLASWRDQLLQQRRHCFESRLIQDKPYPFVPKDSRSARQSR